MELRYRGTAYQTQLAQVESIPSEETARFLGQTYYRRHSQPQSLSQLGLRKYRGVVYGL